MKSKNEKELLDSEIALQKAAMRTVRILLEGERIGYNNALHWAADWITNAATANGSPDVIAFAQNMAMSFNAHKKQVLIPLLLLLTIKHQCAFFVLPPIFTLSLLTRFQ